MFTLLFSFKKSITNDLCCDHTTVLQGFLFNKVIIQANCLSHRTPEQNQRVLAWENVLGRSDRHHTKQEKKNSEMKLAKHFSQRNFESIEIYYISNLDFLGIFLLFLGNNYELQCLFLFKFIDLMAHLWNIVCLNMF